MKNKILSILLVFILLISTIFSSVYGFSYNDTDINLSEIEKNPGSMLLYNKVNGNYYYFVMWSNNYTGSLTDCVYWCKENDDGTVSIGGSINDNVFNSYCLFTYDINTGATINNVSADSTYITFNRNNYCKFTKNFIVIYKTNNVYTDDTYSTLSSSDFFQVAPHPLVEVMKVELREKKTVAEIVGILPLTLVVVVSFLGLRKALSWLLTLLRGC